MVERGGLIVALAGTFVGVTMWKLTVVEGEW